MSNKSLTLAGSMGALANGMNGPILDRLFRRVDNVVWDLMSGKVGIRNNEGVVTFTLEQAAAPSGGAVNIGSININPFESFSVAIPAFASRVSASDAVPGDLIHGAHGPLGWVVERKEVAFVVMKPDGSSTTWTPPKVEMMGTGSGAMVVRSLLQLGGGEQGLGQFQSALLPMIMMGGLNGEGGENGQSPLDRIVPMMMMMQTSDAKGAGMSNIAQAMMMAAMMKGNGFF